MANVDTTDTKKVSADEDLALIAERLDRFVTLYSHSSSGHYRRTMTAMCVGFLGLGGVLRVTVCCDVASPLGLGLFAFALGTGFYMCIYADIIPARTQFMNFAVCIFVGGATMLMAGVASALRRDTVGFTGFMAFGMFYVVIGFYGTLQSAGWYALPSPKGTAALSGLFSVLAFVFLLLTLLYCVLLPVVFFFLMIMFVLVAAGLSGNTTALKAGGWWGIVTAIIAAYSALAFLIEDMWGMEILPIVWTKLAKTHANKIYPLLSVNDPHSGTTAVPTPGKWELFRGDNAAARSQPSLDDMSPFRPQSV